MPKTITMRINDPKEAEQLIEGIVYAGITKNNDSAQQTARAIAARIITALAMSYGERN